MKPFPNLPITNSTAFLLFFLFASPTSFFCKYYYKTLALITPGASPAREVP
jgi:hypothetical protein